MEKIYCSKCGAQLEDTASFCFRCGNKVSTQNTPDIVTNNEKLVSGLPQNPFTKFIFITIAIQIALLMISPGIGNLGGMAFLAAMALSAVVLGFSILTIIKSRKYNHKGKSIGIVFAVLSSICVAILVAAFISVGLDGNNDSSENEYFNSRVNTVAIHSVETLKDLQKDPSSLKINKIYAKIYDTRITAQFSDGTYYDGGDFRGYFEIYIDYTAKNGLGGVNREYCCFKYDQDLILTNIKEIDSMPAVTDDVWVLNTKKYNNLD